MLGRGVLLVALAGGVVAAGSAAPTAMAAAPSAPVAASVGARSASRGTPSEVIDAKTDPQKAGDTLSAGCAGADLSKKCSWTADTSITTGYGPPRILGDALYNCSDEEYAETAVGVSDEREESTSISETLSVEVGLGFLGFEKATAEFEVFSKQSESFSTKVSTTSAVAVPPGWKGWTETAVLSGFVTGSAYVTEGINNLIQVKDIDLSFPGYRNPNDTTDTPIKYIQYRTPMTADDIASRCNAIKGLGGVKLGAPPPVTRLAAPAGSFELTLCQPGGRCATRKVTGAPPPSTGQATATLARSGHTYAAGTETLGSLRLTVRRPIKAGKYTLTISQGPSPSARGHRRAVTDLETIVPITIH